MSSPIRTVSANGDGPGVLASIVSTMVAFALSHSVSMEDISAATGVSGLDLMDPNARLPEDIAPRLCTLLQRFDLEETLSVQLARAAPLSTLGGLAHGAQFADDLRSAFLLVIKNRALLADRLEMELVEQGDDVALAFSHPLDPDDQGFGSEVGTGLLWRMAQEVVDTPIALRRVDLFQRREVRTADRERFFGCPVRLNQPRTALVFSKATLSTPISQANVELFRFVHAYFDRARRRLERSREPEPIHRLLTAMLENAAAGNFSVDAAAARARMSLRTAQRLAAEQGTSPQSMIEDIRADSAREFLADPRLSVERIAQFLGYSDDRAFRRAFKRWTGQTPSEFRRALLG